MPSVFPDMVRKIASPCTLAFSFFHQPDSAAYARRKEDHHGVNARTGKNDVGGPSRRITKSTGDHVLRKPLYVRHPPKPTTYIYIVPDNSGGLSDILIYYPIGSRC